MSRLVPLGIQQAVVLFLGYHTSGVLSLANQLQSKFFRNLRKICYASSR